MKNLKALFIAVIAMFSLLFISNSAQAQTIGYINLETVATNYTYAKNAGKELDEKAYALERYLVDKNKQFNDIESPINKKNFEDQVKKDYAAKKEEIKKLERKLNEEIEKNILEASQAVAAEKNIDIVLDYRVIFTGGIDLTQDVINYLNTNKSKPSKK